MQSVVDWLGAPSTHAIIENLGGYDTRSTGDIEWVG
jgi:hypothetical protein